MRFPIDSNVPRIFAVFVLGPRVELPYPSPSRSFKGGIVGWREDRRRKGERGGRRENDNEMTNRAANGNDGLGGVMGA